MKLPTISVITATYNSGTTLKECLKRVRTQNYPQNKIEIIIGDGGSSDDTLEVAKKYKAKVFKIPENKQNAEYNRGVAFNKAKNELVLILDHDNYMPTSNFLREYVEPFLKHKDLVAVESCWYHYDPKMSLMDRYFALFGALDPVPYYFGKADRLMWTQKRWNGLGKSRDMGKYFLVELESDPRKIPTLGTNGCMMRRDIVFENAKISPSDHYPIDVMTDVIMRGFNKFAFVKNSLMHATGARGLAFFLKRRLKFMREYHFEDLSRRRYSVYMPGDFWKLAKFIFISVTFVKPTLDSLKGFIKLHDIAWFIHPIMCFGVTLMYGYGTVLSLIKKYKQMI